MSYVAQTGGRMIVQEELYGGVDVQGEMSYTRGSVQNPRWESLQRSQCIQCQLQPIRQRTHNLTLPTDVNAVMKQNFVFRMLFTDIYWLSFLNHFMYFFLLCSFFLLYCLVCVTFH